MHEITCHLMIDYDGVNVCTLKSRATTKMKL